MAWRACASIHIPRRSGSNSLDRRATLSNLADRSNYMDTRKGPLSGFRVLELGNLIAAPYAGRLFAEFGADVIKVERPRTGDELRRWRLFRGDTSLFWSLQGRNKRSITLDLRTPEGQEIVLKLLPHVDVVLENFRPGTLEKWNLGYEQMKAVNPDIIFVRISGYGQTGPYRDRPGFGGIAEAMGGLRHLTGYPIDLQPALESVWEIHLRACLEQSAL